MYKYLTKGKAKPYQEVIRNVLNELFRRIKEPVSKSQRDFTFNGFNHVGSGAARLLTCDTDTYFFDLDYNLYINKFPKKWENNLYGLKSFIKTCLDGILKEKQQFIFKDGEDSTSVLTYRIFDKNNKHICNFDLAIFIKDQNSSDFLLLKHDKVSNRYILNERKNTQKQSQMFNIVKKCNKYKDLKRRYLELKNTTKGKPSRELYAQALNEIYLLTPKGQKEARLNNRNNRADQLNPNNAKTKKF